MKGKKIITILVIINILLIGVICNFIKKDYLNNERIIIKTMTETGNESQIETLNQSHQSYKEYIDASKRQLATAITNKGVATTSDSSFETMTANINSIELNDNLDEYLQVKNFSANFTTAYLTQVYVPITIPDGYEVVGLVGWSAYYGFTCYGVFIPQNAQSIAFTISGNGTSTTGACSAYVLFKKKAN